MTYCQSMADVEIEITLSGEARMPLYASDQAAGMDLFAAVSTSLEPMERKIIATGIRMAIPEGYEGQVRARSGLAIKKGLALVNAPGTIDSDYRGEIGVLLINLGSEAVEIETGDRIAQLVICPVVRATLRLKSDGELDGTARGEGGFGSTG